MHPILPDQPNRRIRTRTYGGVGGGSCEAPPYPDMPILLLCLSFFLEQIHALPFLAHNNHGHKESIHCS